MTDRQERIVRNMHDALVNLSKRRRPEHVVSRIYTVINCDEGTSYREPAIYSEISWTLRKFKPRNAEPSPRFWSHRLYVILDFEREVISVEAMRPGGREEFTYVAGGMSVEPEIMDQQPLREQDLDHDVSFYERWFERLFDAWDRRLRRAPEPHLRGKPLY
jgi:hypothetical protein